jgi:hypothetical protein
MIGLDRQDECLAACNTLNPSENVIIILKGPIPGHLCYGRDIIRFGKLSSRDVISKFSYQELVRVWARDGYRLRHFSQTAHTEFGELSIAMH